MKSFLLSLVLLLPFQFYEEVGEEPQPVQDPEPSPTPQIIIDDQNAQTIIDYLERQKAEEQARAEEEKRIKEEEELKLKEEEELKLQEEQNLLLQAIQNTSYTSQSEVRNGWANEKRYYYAGQVLTDNYNRYTYYIYVFDDYTQFEVVGDYLRFKHGNCTLVTIPYNSAVQYLSVNSDIYLERGWVNVYSNIPELDYPALPNVSKDSQIAIEKGIQVMVGFASLLFGYSMLLLIIRGYKR